MASGQKKPGWGTLVLAVGFFLVGMLQIYNGWYADRHHTVAPGRWTSWMTPGQAYLAGFLCLLVAVYALIAAFRQRKSNDIRACGACDENYS
jgi:hypothetical protein